METPLLAAALIVKDEEQYLPDCLAALNRLRPLLSDVFVYDTGSTDATIQIAKDSGAQVVEGYWDNDFARARNAAMDLAKAKWILIVDADERVIIGDKKRFGLLLRSALSANMTGADQLAVTILDAPGEVLNGSWPSARLLRQGRVRYEGKVHELPVAAQDWRTLETGSIPTEVMAIRHVGYVAEAMAGKGSRNTLLAGDSENDFAEIENLAEREKALMNRGRSRKLMGDISGYLQDLAAIRRLEVRTDQRRWAGEQLVDSVWRSNPEAAAQLVGEIRQEGSNNELCDWYLARIRMMQGRHQDALTLLRKVDVPLSAGGLRLPPHDIVEARMLAAGYCGEVDEAAACCVRLMADLGKIEGYGGLLLELWGQRSLDALALLIVEFDRGNLEDIRIEMQRHGGQGEALARLLDPSRVTHQASNASAFGLLS